jgi:8-oxo-dGTP pyrophosphatase MutT (NUDIX family)
VANAKRLRASAVCQAEGHLLVVRLRDPVSGVEALFPPGGGIEPGETAAEAARRETLEETGLRVVVDPKVAVVDRYPFCWAGVDYDVTTHYFAAAHEGRFVTTLPAVIDASYNLGASWLPVAEALASMSVNPAVRGAVERVLHRAERAAWQVHPNIEGPSATLLAIHDQFRFASERLSVLLSREAERDWAFIERAFAPLAQALHHHHRAEEAVLFPLVERRTEVAPVQLLADHEALMRAIGIVEVCLQAKSDRAGAKAAMASFRQVLGGHLEREESVVVPVLLTMSASEAWRLLQGG